MKAADGTPIAEDLQELYRSVSVNDSFTLQLFAEKHRLSLLGNVPIVVRNYLIKRTSAAEERERVLIAEVKKANLWLAHRQQVIDNFFAALATPAPEQPKEAS